ncbi:MAG: SCP2 sterol-binding domain-containing protein [Clostridia bacterium]|nr:SCP2 sterol-binding domain-containing protein [Clostridia bacterium]
MTVSEIVERIRDEIARRPESLAGLEGSFQFVLTGEEGGDFHASVHDGRALVALGRLSSPSVTITMDARDFADMVAGRLSATSAFMSGRLKLEGDVGLALRLQSLIG